MNNEIAMPGCATAAAASGNPGDMSVKIAGGAAWSLLQLGATQGTGLIVRLILTRLLLPEHFGIIGMAVVFTGLFTTIGDLGMGAALIQLRTQKLRPEHLDAAFWLSLAFNGIVFFVLTFAIAPLAASFYDEPLLRRVIPVLAISVCVGSLGLVQRVVLNRGLRFKALGLIDMTGAVISGGVAVAAAIQGAGIWSIVIQGVLAPLVTLPLLWRVVRWFPKPRFSLAAARDIGLSGIYDTLQRATLFLSKNFDYLLIGRLLGKQPLGLYSLAFVLTDTFRLHIMSVLNRVMFPVYGRLQDNAALVTRYYLAAIRFNTLALMPFMVCFLMFAHPLITLLFGDRWAGAVFPLQAMAIASVIHAVGGTSDAILKGLGRFGLNFKICVFTTFAIDLPVYLAGTYLYGIDGMAVAVIISRLAVRIIYQYHLRRLLGVTAWDLLRAAMPALSAALVAAVAGQTLMQLTLIDTPWKLAAAAAICMALYAVTAYWPARHDLRRLKKACLNAYHTPSANANIRPDSHA